MLWTLLSITVALIWAVVSIIDKYVLLKLVKNPLIPAMVLGVVGLLATVIIYLFQGFQPLSFFNIALAFLAGIFIALMWILYFKAVKMEEISRVIPLFYLTPLFVLILGAVFLEEIFSFWQYFGIFLLIIGAIIISIKNFRKIRITKAFLFMILAILMTSINAIIVEYLLSYADFWTIFSYTRIGTIFILIPMFFYSYSDFISTANKYGKKTIGIIFLNSPLAVLGIIIMTAAMAIGYVTLVNALVSTQGFFVLLFTVILSVFYPKIIKEDIKKSTIAMKLIAIILILSGAFLITV